MGSLEFHFNPGNAFGIHSGQRCMMLGGCLMLYPCQICFVQILKRFANVRFGPWLEKMESHTTLHE